MQNDFFTRQESCRVIFYGLQQPLQPQPGF